MQSSMQRVMAIDVMRGLTIVMMILVNNPGSWAAIYWPLKHAEWHGMTPTDLIFPFFIFIMGLSSAYSLFNGRLPTRAMLNSILRRSAILFGLGLLLNIIYFNPWDPSFHWIQEQVVDVRVMGVLQRLAVVYLITAPIVLLTHPTTWFWSAFVLVTLYWSLMGFVPYTIPSGEVFFGQWEKGNSLAAWLDSHVLGARHLYYSNANPLPFDPEGLLSTLSATAGCLFGAWAGHWLQKCRSYSYQVLVMGVMGLGFLLAGQWAALYVPINKALWSPSYLLIATGFALLLLGGLVFALRFSFIRTCSQPFLVAGANSIFFFVFAGLLARLIIMFPWQDTTIKTALYRKLLSVGLDRYPASLLFAVLFLCVCYLPAWWLYKKRIFIRV